MSTRWSLRDDDDVAYRVETTSGNRGGSAGPAERVTPKALISHNVKLKVHRDNMVRDSMSDNDDLVTKMASTNDHSDRTIGRRGVLSLVGAGLGSLAMGSASAGQGNGNAGSNKPWYDWSADVDAHENALENLGTLSTASDSVEISSFTGRNLDVGGDGTLHAQGLPESIHVANNYPGDTLDEKIRNIVDEVPSADPVLPPNQPGHRIVVSGPDPEDPAALDVEGSEVPIWRWEDPVVFDENLGKIVIDMGWTLIFATGELESFFIIGPDQKTENITLNGGFLYSRGNIQDSFVQFGDAGHCHLEELYLQSLEETTPKGIHIRGGTEINVTGVEVTGCTNTLVAENVVDLDVFNHRGGGGENSIVLDGCRGAAINSVHTGSTEPQSVRNDVVRLENEVGPNVNVTITGIRSILQAFDHHAGVSAVDVADGGEKHRNINVFGVDATGAEYGTDLQWVTDYDQQAVSPAPADPDPNGVTRHYEAGINSVATKDAHEFDTESGTAFVVGDDDVRVTGDGSGVVLTTPDGEDQYRICLDNDGKLTTEPV